QVKFDAKAELLEQTTRALRGPQALVPTEPSSSVPANRTILCVARLSGAHRTASCELRKLHALRTHLNSFIFMLGRWLPRQRIARSRWRDFSLPLTRSPVLPPSREKPKAAYPVVA